MHHPESQAGGPLTAEPDAAPHPVRAVRRYVDLLRAALLDEHYLDNEARIEYLLACAAAGEAPDADKLARPTRRMAHALRRLEQERQGGEVPGLAYAGLGQVGLDHLEACVDAICDEGVEGDLVECGTGRGGGAIFLRGLLEAHELADARVWVADRFDGRGTPGPFPADLNSVRDGFARFGLLDERVTFLQGPPAESAAGAPIGAVALLRVDVPDPGEARAVPDALYDRVAPGGFVLVRGPAGEAFRADRGV